MTFPRFTFVHKDQRGFTLVELLVAIAIVGIITLGITMTISQIWTINIGASNHMIAVRQVQQAGKEVSKDTLQAQNVTCGGSNGFSLTLAWEDSEGTANDVTYTVAEDNRLQRSHSIDAGVPTVTYVAQYIDPGETSCDCNCVDCVCDDLVLTFTVTATVGSGPQGASETRVYEIEPRPD